MLQQKIPATVITGFLGAGKTTMIRNLLQNAGGKRIALHCGQTVVRRSQFSLRELQLGNTCSRQAVKARGVVQQRRIAARADIRQDVGHALLDRSVLVGGPVQAGRKIFFKTGTSA